MRRRALCISTLVGLLAIGALGVPIASAADGPQLLPNPSFETPDPDPTINEPAAWNPSHWGSDPATWAPTFDYVTTEGHTGTHSVKVTVASYSPPGDAKWTVDPWPGVGVAVTPGEYYTFSDWYRSDTATKVLAWYKLASEPADGAGHWATLATSVPAADDWTQYTTGFTMPAGATRALFVHVLAGSGYLQTDDYSLKQTEAPAGFTHPFISLTFDDGLKSVMANAIGPLADSGFRSTQYIPTGLLSHGGPDVMSVIDVGALAAGGHEIGSHTVSHDSLLGMTPDQVAGEIEQSKRDLETITGATVDGFAYPFGDSSPAVVAALKAATYRSARSVTPGYNGAALDPFELRVQNMTKDTTLDEFTTWVKYAKAHNYWLVVVYHGVTDTPAEFDTTPAAFQAQLGAIAGEGLSANVVTVRRALDVVTNRFPVGTVSVTPVHPGTNGVLTANPAFTDPDGHALSYRYQWLRGASAIAGATDKTLNLALAGNGDHGDTISVKVTADDGHEGITTAQATVTVANTAPAAGTVAITPPAPRAGSALRAVATGFGDADGDTLGYSYAWLRNGVRLVGQTAATLPGSFVRSGDTLRVEVVAGDGHGGSSAVAAATVKVAAAAPSPPADRAAPTIVVKSPKAKIYRQGRKLTIKFSCTDSSGIAHWTATLRRRGGKSRAVAYGSRIKLNRAGRYVLRITATDGKGNVGTKTVRFRVVRN